MAIDAEKLDQETDAELAALMGLNTEAPAAFAQQENEQDKQTDQNPPADELPPPPAPEPEATDEESEPPAPEAGEDWQDKYTKAEESRKNAHALMTQATQKAADLERSNTELQQQMALLQAKVELLSQQSTAQPDNVPESSDQFQELRKDYQELDPVFNKLDESEQLNRKLEQRLVAIEKARQEQEAEQARQAFWSKLRSLHPDVKQISASEDFKGWFARQTADVQELSRVSPLGAAQVMSLYKEAAGLNKAAPKPAPDPTQKMQQAKQMSEPPVRSRSTPTTQGRQPAMTLEQIAAMPQKEFDANEEKLDEVLAQWIKQGGRL